MTVREIMTELQSLGDPGIKKIFLKHGIREPLFGFKIEHLKKIRKKIKTDYQLAKDLYATGNADAMYLASLIADDAKMTPADLRTWVKQAVSHTISEYAVPWVASGNSHGYQLAMEWIDSGEDHIAAAGWSTLGGWVSLRPDEELDIAALKGLLERVVRTIPKAGNRTRYTMNGFVIAVGSFVKPLTSDAIAAAGKLGEVTVDMNGTACKVPDAASYISKIKDRGAWEKKKKTIKC
jgi:hypothetical protein